MLDGPHLAGSESAGEEYPVGSPLIGHQKVLNSPNVVVAKSAVAGKGGVNEAKQNNGIH